MDQTQLSLHATDGSTYTTGFARAINGDGAIVGYGLNGSTVNVLFWYKNGSAWGQPNNAGAPAGQAYAYAISDAYQAVGEATFVSGGPFHAFFYDPTTGFTDFGTLGGTASEAFDVNDEAPQFGVS